LARVELARGHAANAIVTLQSALRGPVAWLYLWQSGVTHTDLHDVLAKAFAAAGQPDSARAHYAFVARAWRGGDPPFRIRAESAATKARLARPPVGAAPEPLHH